MTFQYQILEFEDAVNVTIAQKGKQHIGFS